MPRSVPAAVRRSGLHSLSFALGIAMLCGVTHAGPPEAMVAGDRSLLRATQGTLIGLDALFAEDDLYAVTPRRGSPCDSVGASAVTASPRDVSWCHRTTSSISLVSLETLYESSSADSISPAETPPTFVVPQQPVFQEAVGDAFSGPSTTQGTWVLVAPYGWISGINGQIVTPGRVLDVNVSPSDVLQHLGDLNGAFMLHTEVGRGDWGLILDANLIRLSPQVTTATALIDVTLQQTLMEFLGMYRLVEASDYLVEGKSLTVDLLAGARYYQVGNALTVYPFAPGPTLFEERSKTWVDLVIGARARAPLTSSLDVFVRADVGGFGIGSSSNLAWNLVAGLDYQMNSSTSLLAGYRVLDIDQISGAGATAFGFDVQLQGPFVALTFQF